MSNREKPVKRPQAYVVSPASLEFRDSYMDTDEVNAYLFQRDEDTEMLRGFLAECEQEFQEKVAKIGEQAETIARLRKLLLETLPSLGPGTYELRQQIHRIADDAIAREDT